MTPRSDLHHDRYPRSNGYDPAWVAEHQMGPNALWLTEAVTQQLEIEPGSRILDLGCGKALSSIFLAKEFGAQVWATDLWIEAAENQARVEEAGVADLVTPVHAEAHQLPFEPDAFDLIISIDAYQYFGTADLYLGYLVDFVRMGGRLGMAMPALTSEVGDTIPEPLVPYWEWDFCAFHSPQWWRTHWNKTGKVQVDHAELIEDGWKDWHRFNAYIAPLVEGWWVDDVARTNEMLEADRGANLGFTLLTATKVEPRRPSGPHGF